MTRNLLALTLAISLAACGGVETSSSSLRTEPIAYTLDASGVQLLGQSQRIDFGRTDHSTELAMAKLVGQPASFRGVCPDGLPYVDWPDGTRLFFRGGAFRGWSKTSADGAVLRAGMTCA